MRRPLPPMDVVSERHWLIYNQLRGGGGGNRTLVTLNPNPMVVHDFGLYGVKTIELPRRFFSPAVPPQSPGVLPSLGDILETPDH